MGIKEELEPLRKQGYNDYQIKSFLTQKGYGLDEINNELNAPKTEEKPHKKKDHRNLLIIVLVIGILLLGFEMKYYFFNEPKPIITEMPTFSDNPIDWIEDTNTSVKIINISEATEYQSEYIYGQQVYIEETGNLITLDHFGIYNNIQFKDNHIENNNYILKISQEINPNDGISEVFAFFRKEEFDFNVYILVDEDWKKESYGNINIIWGEDINNQNTLNFNRFNFSNNKEGIYINKISDVSWIVEPEGYERIIVGEVNLDQIRLQNYSNSKFMIFI